ncbi:MAG: hypothetical protein HKN09_06135 [Saprospiraceae bacterium]|nr:hypothetical protein [Saprospiraceae bacterium]
MSTNSIIRSFIDEMVNLKYIFLLLAAVVVMGCNSADDLETDPELEPYFDLFAAEALLRGITVDYEARRIEGLIQDIPNTSIQGQCFRNEERPNKVVIDVNYWNNATEEEKQFIIFHELGHCFLDRAHLDTRNSDGTCVSIMHSSPSVCAFNLTEQNRKDYFNELFLN